MKTNTDKTGPQASAADALQKIEFFRTAPQSVVDQLCARARILTNLPKNHVLFMQDDVAEWFYIVGSGWVKLFRETLDGDEAVLDVMPQGNIFGETAILENNSYACSAEIVENAVLYAYPLAVLEDALRHHNDLALSMLRHINRKNIFREKEIEHKTVQNAPQRIGCYLLRLCGSKSEKNPVILHLPHDKILIAARLGMQPETFSRALQKLQQDVGIVVRGYTVEIGDMDALIGYTCSACSNVFPCED